MQEARVSEAEITFGNYVRQLRSLKKLHAQELAARIGVSAAYVARVELGYRAPFCREHWAALVALGADARVLEVLSDAYIEERAGRTAGRPTREEKTRVPDGAPRSSTWEDLPWEEDDWCWYAVAHHPDGLSRDQIAVLTGWSAKRVEDLEQSALAKLARDKDAREALESLKLLHSHRDGMLHAAMNAE